MNDHNQAVIEELHRVVEDLTEEASSELYSEGEKVAILACIERVRDRINERSYAKLGEQYTAALAKSMQETKEAVMSTIMARHVYTSGGTT